MTTYTKVKVSPREYADRFACGTELTFQSRELRDEVASILRGLGKSFKKRSSRHQLTHPEYVDDFEGVVESGFGNTMYKTYFPGLYHLEQVR
jgi:hypothetical protein